MTRGSSESSAGPPSGKRGDDLAQRLLNAQAELQTALGMLRLNGEFDSYVEMRLQASLAMQHELLASLGLPMYQPAQMPDGWTPA